jgi:hypothetical protein
MFSVKKWFYQKIDNYIIKYHSQDYIRRDLIQDEIELRMKNAVIESEKLRDFQEHTKLEDQRLKFDIKEAGWKAEIENLVNVAREATEMRDDVLDLRHNLYKTAKALAMVTAENKHEGNNIINSVSESIGKLDKIGLKAKNIKEKMDEKKNEDEERLRIK